jgi:uncharacterized protein (TIGR02145 family)
MGPFFIEHVSDFGALVESPYVVYIIRTDKMSTLFDCKAGGKANLMKQWFLIMASVLPLVIGCGKNPTQPLPKTGTMSDIDGNVYHYVTIGTQTWMAENLKTTRLNDGTTIPLVTVDTLWAALTTPGFCWYNDSDSYKATYGALYNWYAVNTGKLAPKGWHVPTDSEWTVLTTFLGGTKVAGGKLKDTGTAYWDSPNTGATDEYGFKALPGGCRIFLGSFWYAGTFCYLWSATAYDSTSAWDRVPVNNDTYVGVYFNLYQYGIGVRCVRDN